MSNGKIESPHRSPYQRHPCLLEGTPGGHILPNGHICGIGVGFLVMRHHLPFADPFGVDSAPAPDRIQAKEFPIDLIFRDDGGVAPLHDPGFEVEDLPLRAQSS